MRLISLNQVFNDGVCRDRGPDTRAATRNIGHSLKSDNSRIWALWLSPSSHHQIIPRHGKRMFVGVSWHETPDMMWRMTAAWHHNTWHQSVTPETEITQNSYPGVSGCYGCIFRLRRVTSVTPAQAVVCGVSWHVSRGRTLTITELSSGICHRVLWSIFWLELYKGIRLVTT